MSYISSDPRSTLRTAQPVAAPDGAPLATQHFDFTELDPDDVSPTGSRTWLVRGHNIVFALTELEAGDRLVRDDADEVIGFTPAAGAGLQLAGGDRSVEVVDQAVWVLPPGRTSITATTSTRLVRLFTLRATDLVERCRNAAAYAVERPPTAAAEPWPEPVAGAELRVYPGIADIPRSADRFGRIFRNRHAMINILYPRKGPRDPSTLSPHLHEDFEQLSYADSGEHVHHVRTAWGPDRRLWREDEHVRIGSPSLTIIPPPLLHTSEASGAGVNQLIDIFAGPRTDFSERSDWVLNAEDYPMAHRGEQ